ncbi:MAG: DUF167 domain-containing protein [Verrucomicrobiota bacterium]
MDAAANEALIRLLAEKLDCPRSKVDITRGQTSRHKTVTIWGMTAEKVLKQLGF